MTRQEAIRKIMKTLGPKAYWTIKGHITSPERREQATVQQLDAHFRRAMIKRDLSQRSAQLLAADAIYQAHLADWRLAQDEPHSSTEGGYKFEVGTRDGIFVTPRAYGDTWEDVFAKLSTGKVV